MVTSVLNVPDISCAHCEHTIDGALRPLAGVRQVSVDIPSHSVTVEFDEASIGLERIKEVLAAEEYPVASVS